MNLETSTTPQHVPTAPIRHFENLGAANPTGCTDKIFRAVKPPAIVPSSGSGQAPGLGGVVLVRDEGAAITSSGSAVSFTAGQLFLVGDEGAAFLADLYQLHEAGQTDHALDLIFHWVDRQFKAGRRGAARCDSVLFAIDVRKLDEDLLVGLLTATHAGANLIRGRLDFACRVKNRLAEDIGPAVANSLVDELT